MSRFGSHKSMVDQKVTKNLNMPGKVACRDEYGIYITSETSLDNGRADNNRFNKQRMERFVSPEREWVHK